MTGRRALLLLAVTALLLGAGLAACQGPGTKVANVQPVARLTAGPVEGSEEFYSVPFSWTAYDPDGSVDYFLYAIDDTSGAAPLDSCVAADGVGYDYAPGWHCTKDHTKTLIFSATTRSDSTSDIYKGFHTFYLKAVDNEGIGSRVVSLSFDAKTIAPMTCFTQPTSVAAGQGYNSPLLGGPSIRIEWDGDDPDGVESHEPVEYVVTRVKTGPNYAGQFDAADVALRGPEAQRIVVPGEQNFYIFNDLAEVGTAANWIFAVQGVDEAGATEPIFRGSISSDCPNMFFFRAAGNLQGPVLSVSSIALGVFVAQGVSRDSSQYVFDKPIALSWTADASAYGATVDAFRWGVDVVDITDDRDPGWASGWSATLMQISGLRFSDHLAATHDIVIQARDSNGSVTSAFIRLTLVEFPFDRDVLFVDDEFENWSAGYYPTSAEHKDFMVTVLSEALANLGRPAVVDTLNPFRGETYLNVTLPVLTDLAHYRCVIWDIGASGIPSSNTFYPLISVDPNVGPTHSNILATYLESGGTLMLSGFKPVVGTIATATGPPPPSVTMLGPANGLEPGANNFAFDYWGIPNEIFVADTPSRKHGLIACEPTEYGRSHGFLGGWPRLELDDVRWYRLAAALGPVGFEAFSKQPRVSEGRDVAFTPYSYVATGGSTGSNASYMHGKYNFLLFKKATLDPAVEDWKYQVAYAPFRLYLYKPEGIAGMLTNVLYEFLNDKKWGAARVSATPRLAAADAPPTAP